MAIRNTVTTLAGLVVTNAYTRVENINMMVKGEASFDAATYNESPEKNPFKAAVERFSCPVDLEKPLHPQLYAFLKTTEKFLNAVDC